MVGKSLTTSGPLTVSSMDCPPSSTRHGAIAPADRRIRTQAWARRSSRAFGSPMPLQIGRAGHDREAERLRDPHRDHVGRDELAHPNAGIEAVLRQIDQFFTRDDLHDHFGIGLRERGQDRLQEERHHGPGDGQAKKAGWPIGQPPGRVAGGNDFVERRSRMLEESLARLGQADAARGAGEQRDADPGLESTDRLADRRRRHPQIIGSLAEAAPRRHAQECFDAIQRAARHRVVRLHGS